MDEHYARLVELSQVKDGWYDGKGKAPNKRVFLDVMYVVGLCYIHNIKIKEISIIYFGGLRIIFDREDNQYFSLSNDGIYSKKGPFHFYKEDLKNVLLDEFKPMSKTNSGPLP
jgi:hypothetical protein